MLFAEVRPPVLGIAWFVPSGMQLRKVVSSPATSSNVTACECSFSSQTEMLTSCASRSNMPMASTIAIK